MSTIPPFIASARLERISDADTARKADAKTHANVTPKLEASGASYESVPSLLLSEGVMSPVEGEEGISHDDPGAKIIGLANFKECAKLESLSETQSLESASSKIFRASEGSHDQSASRVTSSTESWGEKEVNEINPSWLTASSQLDIDDSTIITDTRGDANEALLFDNSARSRTVSENSVGSLRLKSGTCIDPFPSPTSTPRTTTLGIPSLPLLSPDLFTPTLESCEDEYNYHSLARQNHHGQTPAFDYSPKKKRTDYNKSPSRFRSNNETPPYTPQSPYLPQPTTQYSVSTLSTRTQQTAASAQSPMLKSGNHRMWKDPFPTPDVSLHGQFSTLRDDEIAIVCDDPNLVSGRSVENIRPLELNRLLSPPPLPLKEELQTVQVTEDCIIQPSRAAGSRRALQQKSRSSKELMGFFEKEHRGSGFFKVRRISSEASLMLPLENDHDKSGCRGNVLPLRTRTSMDDFWKAFQSGPDGNDLELEDLLQTRKKTDVVDRKVVRKGDNERISRHKSFTDKRQREDSGRRSLQKRGKSLTLEDIGDDYHERVDVASLRQYSNVGPVRSVSMYSTRNDHAAETEWLGLRKRPTERSSSVAADSSSSTSKQVLPMTPTRKSIESWTSFRSPVVGQVRESAEDLVFSPVRSLIAANSERAVKMVHHNSKRAVKLVRNTQRRLKERGKLRRQRRLARIKEPPPSWWIVIPADHPYKIAWDVMTMIWALMGAYRTHTRIRDRVFDQSPLILLTEIWFTLDILLNFVTEHKTTKGQVIRDGKTVWARYLTTWFVFDLLSLIPWERIYVRPVVEKIKKRNIFQKTFFRSKAVVRVSRVLRGRHIKLFGRVSKQTGTPIRRLVNLSIKYIPKYLLFYRNMRGALAVRTMRLIHWLHNLYKGFWVKAKRRMTRRGRGLRADVMVFRKDINDGVEDDDEEEEDEEEEEEDDGDDVDDDDDEDDNDHDYDSEAVDNASVGDFTDCDSPQLRILRDKTREKRNNTPGAKVPHGSDLSSRRRTFSEY